MTNIYLAIAGLFGLAFGSFANVLILRDKKRLTILNERSECPNCKHQLSWLDLFPVFSYLFLGGKCRYCHKKISIQYPIVELLTAGLFVLAFYIGGSSILLSVSLAMAFLCFLVASVIDFKDMEVPVEYTTLAGIIGGLAAIVSGQLDIKDVLYGVLIGAGLLLFIQVIWKLLKHEEGMGSGDIWIAGAVGAIVGWPLILVALFSAVLTGAIIGLIVMAMTKNDLKLAIPFGPFLFWGMLMSLVWGNGILSWYLM